ncbi:hypothetical protein LXL04_025753 [Taraxacum kok-saghyz]
METNTNLTIIYKNFAWGIEDSWKKKKILRGCHSAIMHTKGVLSLQEKGSSVTKHLNLLIKTRNNVSRRDGEAKTRRETILHKVDEELRRAEMDGNRSKRGMKEPIKRRNGEQINEMEMRFDRNTDVARSGSFWLTQFAIQSIDLVKGTAILIFQKKKPVVKLERRFRLLDNRNYNSKGNRWSLATHTGLINLKKEVFEKAEAASKSENRFLFRNMVFPWLTSTLSTVAGSLIMLISWATKVSRGTEAPNTDLGFCKFLFPHWYFIIFALNVQGMMVLKDVGQLINLIFKHAKKLQPLSGSTTFNQIELPINKDPLNEMNPVVKSSPYKLGRKPGGLPTLDFVHVYVHCGSIVSWCTWALHFRIDSVKARPPMDKVLDFHPESLRLKFSTIGSQFLILLIAPPTGIPRNLKGIVPVLHLSSFDMWLTSTALTPTAMRLHLDMLIFRPEHI